MGDVVVLNGSGQYWGDRSLKDIIRLHSKDKITTLMVDTSRIIRGGVNRNGEVTCMETPLVVMLKTFFGCTIEAGPLAYDDEMVYERDQNYCQYWHFDSMGRRFMYKCTKDDRSIDHIIPRCEGGVDSYTNCVCACKVCNIKRKGRLSIKEAGLKLIRAPFVPAPRRGGWACMNFEFNPQITAHVAYKRYLESLAA